MKEKNANKNTNIKQILTLILFVIIIFIGIYSTNNYNANQNKVNIEQTISYTLDNIPKYSSKAYVIINNNIPNFDDEYFTKSSLYRVTPIYEDENKVASRCNY